MVVSSAIIGLSVSFTITSASLSIGARQVGAFLRVSALMPNPSGSSSRSSSILPSVSSFSVSVSVESNEASLVI